MFILFTYHFIKLIKLSLNSEVNGYCVIMNLYTFKNINQIPHIIPLCINYYKTYFVIYRRLYCQNLKANSN